MGSRSSKQQRVNRKIGGNATSPAKSDRRTREEVGLQKPLKTDKGELTRMVEGTLTDLLKEYAD